MNPKIEIVKGNILTEQGFEELRRELKQFAEAHKVVNISIAVVARLAAGGAEGVIATILYEWRVKEPPEEPPPEETDNLNNEEIGDQFQ